MYCGNCGEKLDKQNKIKKALSKKGLLVLITLVFIAIIASCLLIFYKTYVRNYDETLEKAQQYVADLNYKMAEDTYLEAIDIDPKLPDAYEELVDVYLDQFKTKEALEIMDLAIDNVSEEHERDIKYKYDEVTTDVDNLDIVIDAFEVFESGNLDQLYNTQKLINEHADYFINRLKQDDNIIYIPDGNTSGKGIGIYIDYDFLKNSEYYKDLHSIDEYINVFIYFGNFNKTLREGEFIILKTSVLSMEYYYVANFENDSIDGEIICENYTYDESTEEIMVEHIDTYNFSDGKIDGNFKSDIYEDGEYCCTTYGTARDGIINRIQNDSIDSEYDSDYIIASGKNGSHVHYIYYSDYTKFDEYTPPYIYLP